MFSYRRAATQPTAEPATDDRSTAANDPECQRFTKHPTTQMSITNCQINSYWPPGLPGTPRNSPQNARERAQLGAKLAFLTPTLHTTRPNLDTTAIKGVTAIKGLRLLFVDGWEDGPEDKRGQVRRPSGPGRGRGSPAQHPTLLTPTYKPAKEPKEWHYAWQDNTAAATRPAVPVGSVARSVPDPGRPVPAPGAFAAVEVVLQDLETQPLDE